jgi:predicted alternative tryptophan synthase beta-subunit
VAQAYYNAKEGVRRLATETGAGQWGSSLAFAGALFGLEVTVSIRAAVDEAKKADEEGKSRVILFNLSGHGHFDLAAYDQWFAGKLEDFDYPKEAVEKAMANLPRVDVA